MLFTGVATNFSVEGTARQASDLGYRTIIVADACSAADPATHDASIASLGLLAEIAPSAEVLEALSVTATPVTLNVCAPRDRRVEDQVGESGVDSVWVSDHFQTLAGPGRSRTGITGVPRRRRPALSTSFSAPVS